MLGTFPTEAAARRVAFAHRDWGDVHLDPQMTRGRLVGWRAEVVGLTQAEAQNLCATLAKQREACTIVRPDPNQLASR